LAARLADKGHTVTTQLDNHDKSVVLALDYRLGKTLMVELSGGTLGAFEASVSSAGTPGASLAQDLVDQKPAGGGFIAIGLRQDFPLVANLMLTSRAALTGYRQTFTIRTGSTVQEFSDSGLGWMAGAGLTWLLTPGIGIGVGTDWFDQGDHGAIALLHAGIEYRF
jgi:hypothetical protein